MAGDSGFLTLEIKSSDSSYDKPSKRSTRILPLYTLPNTSGSLPVISRLNGSELALYCAYSMHRISSASLPACCTSSRISKGCTPWVRQAFAQHKRNASRYEMKILVRGSPGCPVKRSMTRERIIPYPRRNSPPYSPNVATTVSSSTGLTASASGTRPTEPGAKVMVKWGNCIPLSANTPRSVAFFPTRGAPRSAATTAGSSGFWGTIVPKLWAGLFLYRYG